MVFEIWDYLWNSIYIHSLFWRKIRFWGKVSNRWKCETSRDKCSYSLLLMYIREKYYFCVLVKTYLYVTTNMQCLVQAHLYFALNIHAFIKIYLRFTINMHNFVKIYLYFIDNTHTLMKTYPYFTLNMHSLGTTYQYFIINMSSVV